MSAKRHGHLRRANLAWNGAAPPTQGHALTRRRRRCGRPPTPLPGPRLRGRFVAICPWGPGLQTRKIQRQLCQRVGSSCSAVSRSRPRAACGTGSRRPWRIGGAAAAAGQAVSAPGRLRDRAGAPLPSSPIGPQDLARPQTRACPADPLRSPEVPARPKRPLPAAPPCELTWVGWSLAC